MARKSPLYYAPVKNKRFFGPTRLYSQIDWNDFLAAMREFKKQMCVWYIAPALVLKKRTRHSGFAYLGLNCLLIDAICQYYYGKREATKRDFKKFVRKHFDGSNHRFSAEIPVVINGKSNFLRDFADVLYHGVRCGILHEAHTKSYCGIAGLPKRTWTFRRKGFTKVSGRLHGFRDCPSVIIDPNRLLVQTIAVFNRYINDLRNPHQTKLRERFKRRFLWSFGIAIGREPLI
jgi:hypothetical protein